MKKAQQKHVWLMRQIEAHCNFYEITTSQYVDDTQARRHLGERMLRFFERLRRRAERLAARRCGDSTANIDECEREEALIRNAIKRKFKGRFPRGLILNGDPRGWGIVIDSERFSEIRERCRFDTDLGGNALLGNSFSD